MGRWVRQGDGANQEKRKKEPRIRGQRLEVGSQRGEMSGESGVNSWMERVESRCCQELGIRNTSNTKLNGSV